MSVHRQIPTLGQPTKLKNADARREPRLPDGCAPIPARGPKLSAVTADARNR